MGIVTPLFNTLLLLLILLARLLVTTLWRPKEDRKAFILIIMEEEQTMDKPDIPIYKNTCLCQHFHCTSYY